MTVYHISSSEIDRRMVAFTDLLIALYIGMLIGALALLSGPIKIVVPFVFTGTILYFLFAFLVHHLMRRFFVDYSQSKVSLAATYLEKTTMNSKEKIYYKDMQSLKVLWTTRDLVRDIEIKTKDGKTFVMDGMEAFGDLKNELEDKSGMVAVEEKEPADFDHQLFYPLLGLVLGLGSMAFMRFVSRLDINQLEAMYKGFSAYLLLLGIYFLVARPFTQRYGARLQRNDYMYAIVSILASLILLKLP